MAKKKRSNRLVAHAVWSTRSHIVYADVQGLEVVPGMLNSEVLMFLHRIGFVKWLDKADFTLEQEGTVVRASTGIYFIKVIKPGQIRNLRFV